MPMKPTPMPNKPMPKPTPMPNKPTPKPAPIKKPVPVFDRGDFKRPKKPIMLPKTGMSKGGMAKAKGMAYGGMTEKPMGMNMGGMAKPGYGDQSMPKVPKPKVKPGAGTPTKPSVGHFGPKPAMGMAKGGMTKKGKK